MPYRDDYLANQARLQQLDQELAETKAELRELGVKYARACTVLRMVAESKRVERLLEERSEKKPATGSDVRAD